MLQNQELVSIITPTYNSEKYIGSTIESIIAQTYTNWELLITDDCSTDSTCKIVEGYAATDSRIKLFRLEKNGGGGIARSNSIENANGRYLAFCDSDDMWLPNKLEKQLLFMKEKDCTLSFSSYLTCSEDGNVNGIIVGKSKVTYREECKDNQIGCLTAIYDTKPYGKIFFPSIRKRQDWGFMVRALEKCGVAYGMKEPLAIYRLRQGSISSNKLQLVKYNIMFYKEVLHYSNIKSVCMFLFCFLPKYLWKKRIQSIYNK